MAVALPITRTGTRSTRRPRGRVHWLAYAFIAPFFIVFVAMVIVPLGYAVWASTYRNQLIGGDTFVGLANYLAVFRDHQFYAGLGRVCLYMAISIPLTLGLALLFALAFDSGRMRGASTSRLIMFLPNAVPAVVATLMWGYLYGNDFGPIAQIFRAVGLPSPQLLSPGKILFSVINIAFWSVLGYTMIILYSALQSIPGELYEAARIDGASEIRIARSIKVPAVLPSLALCAILAVIGGFQLFNEPNLLQPMAPAAISTDWTPNMYIYATAFSASNVGYATAMSIVLGLIIIAFTLLTRVGSRKKAQR